MENKEKTLAELKSQAASGKESRPPAHASSLQYGRRYPKHFQRGRLFDKGRVLLSDGTGFCAACGAGIGGHRCAEPRGGR